MSEFDCRITQEGLVGTQKIIVLEQMVKHPKGDYPRFVVASVLADIDPTATWYQIDPHNVEVSKNVHEQLKGSRQSNQTAEKEP